MTAVRLVQLARIFGLDPSTLDEAAARAAISARPRELAAAFFEEAAQNDDVTGAEGAQGYLDDRLAQFHDLITPAAEAALREKFGQRLKAWA
ncbi:MAG: hypothetical protein WEC33_05440 [Dehalococcoidia bacterium]